MVQPDRHTSTADVDLPGLVLGRPPAGLAVARLAAIPAQVQTTAPGFAEIHRCKGLDDFCPDGSVDFRFGATRERPVPTRPASGSREARP